jgi:hypothetical protein
VYTENAFPFAFAVTGFRTTNILNMHEKETFDALNDRRKIASRLTKPNFGLLRVKSSYLTLNRASKGSFDRCATPTYGLG